MGAASGAPRRFRVPIPAPPFPQCRSDSRPRCDRVQQLSTGMRKRGHATLEKQLQAGKPAWARWRCVFRIIFTALHIACNRLYQDAAQLHAPTEASEFQPARTTAKSSSAIETRSSSGVFLALVCRVVSYVFQCLTSNLNAQRQTSRSRSSSSLSPRLSSCFSSATTTHPVSRPRFSPVFCKFACQR